MIDSHAWVPAAPFRAQLRHLLDASALPLPHLASVLELPVRLCARLLVEPAEPGPAGRAAARTDPLRPRPLVRISPITARQLLAVDAITLIQALSRSLDARPTCETVVELLGAGHRLTTLQRVTGLDLPTLAALAEFGVSTCPGRVVAAVRAAATWAETHPATTRRRRSRTAVLRQVRAELSRAAACVGSVDPAGSTDTRWSRAA